MGDKSLIEWTEATWNPTTGCTKISPGCKHCYAKREWERLSANPATVYYGRRFEDVQVHRARLEVPRLWAKPRMIFVDSMSDLFHEAIPDHFIRECFAVMRTTPRHTYQVLTKRDARMLQITRELAHDWEGVWSANIWLGVSTEDQMHWDERVTNLLASPAITKFVSAEPLLGIIDGRGSHRSNASYVSVPPARDWPLAGISWLICGGETGPDARPTSPRWVRWLRDQCQMTGTPFFFKQWGDWVPIDQVSPLVAQRTRQHREFDGVHMIRVGKKLAGAMLDGVEERAWPISHVTPAAVSCESRKDQRE